MNRPLQLYLDSSDYSTFGDVKDGKASAEVEARYRTLQRYIEQGDIECRYSALHIVEAAPIEQDYIDKAASRLSVMRDLCGKKVFLGPFDLVIPDVLSAYLDEESPLSRPVERRRFHARNDRGHWLPSGESQFAELQHDLKRMIGSPYKFALSNDEEMAKIKDDPELMRRLRLATSTPLARTQFRQLIVSNWPEFYAKLKEEVLASDEDSQLWLAFVLGNVSSEQLMERWMESLSDLPRIAPMIGSRSGRVFSGLTKWFRDGSGKLGDVMLPALQMQKRMRSGEFSPELSEYTRALQKDLSKEFRSDREASEIARAKATITNPEFKAAQYGKKLPSKRAIITNETLLAQSASVRGMTEVITAYFAKAVSAHEMPRKSEKLSSDVGDVLHASYIPYCDVFRCDSFSESYLASVAKMFGTTVVPKQSTLIQSLDMCLIRSA